MKRAGLVALAMVVQGTAWATPAAPVALLDRSTWPQPIVDSASFDLASRAEVLTFAEALSAAGPAHDAELAKELGVSNPDLASAAKFRARAQAAVLSSYAHATAGCRPGALLCPAEAPKDWAGLEVLAPAALESLAPGYAAWRTQARAFHRAYLREQLRLAYLFSRVTSEILPLDPSEAFDGALPDKQFLLTFDDGPMPKGGQTEKVVALLTAHHSNGMFFTLGNAMHARLAASPPNLVRALYAGQCVASHGMEHKSHVSWKEADAQLAIFDDELAVVLPEGQAKLKWFRPPYGQRSAALVKKLEGQGIGTMLWNIDSQDWQHAVSPAAAGDRVATLMLLWRHGVVLFHDVHEKAAGALPRLFSTFDASGVVWADCRAQ